MYPNERKLIFYNIALPRDASFFHSRPKTLNKEVRKETNAYYNNKDASFYI